MSPSKVLILSLIVLIRITSGYRYVLIPRSEKFDRCRSNTCSNGELHSICLKQSHVSANCTGFKLLPMTARRKEILINGHNGIRNKLAGEWNIANMFILHWDKDLAKMARGFLTRCIIGRDSCNYIYNSTFTVGQTFYYNPKLPLNRFVITIMRYWFLEINEIQSFQEYLHAKPPNVTVMANPTTEFVGCAAAEMYGGHMMRCYYSPSPNDDSKTYVPGKPCRACPEERSSCSRLFHGLCGLDVPLPSMTIKYQMNYFNLLLMFITNLFLLKSEL